MSTTPTAAPPSEIDLPRLEKTLRHPRALFSFGMSALTGRGSWVPAIARCILPPGAPAERRLQL